MCGMFKKEDLHDKITFLTWIDSLLKNLLQVSTFGNYGVREGIPEFIDPKKVETGP